MTSRPIALLSLLLSANPAWSEEPQPGTERRFDLELTAFASTPERFSGCVGAHPWRRIEIDGCLSGDRSVLAFASHAFYRWQWSFAHGDVPGRGLVLAVGPGVGGRVSAFCPFQTCFFSGGPEVLASFEVVEWLKPGLGISLQLDAGLAVLWVKDSTGVVDRAYRFPARLLFGVSL